MFHSIKSVVCYTDQKKVTYLDALGNVIVKSTSRIDKMYMVGFCFMQANLFLYF